MAALSAPSNAGTIFSLTDAVESPVVFGPSNIDPAWVDSYSINWDLSILPGWERVNKISSIQFLLYLGSRDLTHEIFAYLLQGDPGLSSIMLIGPRRLVTRTVGPSAYSVMGSSFALRFVVATSGRFSTLLYRDPGTGHAGRRLNSFPYHGSSVVVTDELVSERGTAFLCCLALAAFGVAAWRRQPTAL